jgi:hypothetical protein
MLGRLERRSCDVTLKLEVPTSSLSSFWSSSSSSPCLAPLLKKNQLQRGTYNMRATRNLDLSQYGGNLLGDKL